MKITSNFQVGLNANNVQRNLNKSVNSNVNQTQTQTTNLNNMPSYVSNIHFSGVTSEKPVFLKETDGLAFDSIDPKYFQACPDDKLPLEIVRELDEYCQNSPKPLAKAAFYNVVSYLGDTAAANYKMYNRPDIMVRLTKLYSQIAPEEVKDPVEAFVNLKLGTVKRTNTKPIGTSVDSAMFASQYRDYERMMNISEQDKQNFVAKYPEVGMDRLNAFVEKYPCHLDSLGKCIDYWSSSKSIVGEDVFGFIESSLDSAKDAYISEQGSICYPTTLQDQQRTAESYGQLLAHGYPYNRG